MDVLDAEVLKAAASTLAPGLLIVGVRRQFLAGPRPRFEEQAVLYAVVSALYFAVASPIFRLVEPAPGFPEAAWYALEHAVAPIVIGVASGVSASKNLIGRAARIAGLPLAHQIPTVWDLAFATLRRQSYVVVTLTDGSQVYGYFGPNSFASSTDHDRDLLIEQVWEIDAAGNWSKSATDRSILLSGRDVRSIEFLE